MSKVYIGKSGIQGKGVFAKRDIKKGEIIGVDKGEVIKFTIKNPKDSKIGPRWIGIGKNLWFNSFEGTAFDFLNHSCNPNAGIKGRITYVALKNIKKDEEITIDYSIADEDAFWKMKCCCGHKECRGTIRSIQSLPYETFKKYLPYVPTYFKKVYLREKGLALKAD